MCKDLRTVSEHIGNVYEEGELDREGTVRKFRIVRQEGKRQVQRAIEHYNLDVIISVGYRVKSHRGVKWTRSAGPADRSSKLRWTKHRDRPPSRRGCRGRPVLSAAPSRSHACTPRRASAMQSVNAVVLTPLAGRLHGHGGGDGHRAAADARDVAVTLPNTWSPRPMTKTLLTRIE
ncbi:RhuM family protein [Halomonas cerina]|uniref:RhuM family protein n=1 Tax=Halomonas cerina TaxID=447424 RepID=UPI0031B5D062